MAAFAAAAASNPTIYYAKYDGDDPIGGGWTEIVISLRVLDAKKLIQNNDYVMIVNNTQKQILIFRITELHRMPVSAKIISIFVNTTGGNYKVIDMRGVTFSTIKERIEDVYEQLGIRDTVHLNESNELTITEGPYFGLPYFNIIGGKRLRRTNKRGKRRSIKKRRTNKRRRRY